MNYNLDLVILKTLITNKKYALDFVNECDTKLFSSDVWNFANIIVNHIKTYKNLPTLRVLTEKTKGDRLIENIKSIWGQLEEIKYDDKEYHHDLEKIKKRFAEKQLISLKDKFSDLEPGTIDISKSIVEMQRTIKSVNDLNNTKSFEKKTLKEALPAFVEQFNAKKNNPDLATGLKTGYSFLDYACNGVKEADLILVCGESGQGKSLLLGNMFYQIWMRQNDITSNNMSEGKNVVMFSLEMPYEDYFNRILARMARVPIRKIENASLTKEEFHKVRMALDFIKNYPYNFEIIDIADICANDIQNILEEIQYPIDAVAVDYLGIMSQNKESDDSDWQKQGTIAYELRHVGRKLKLPIFSAVQLNRKTQGKDPDGGIGLNRLARSNSIATHASTVIQIETRPQEDTRSDLNVHIIKQRKGPKLKGSLLKDLKCGTLLDVPVEYETNSNYFTDVDDISNEIEDLDL